MASQAVSRDSSLTSYKSDLQLILPGLVTGPNVLVSWQVVGQSSIFIVGLTIVCVNVPFPTACLSTRFNSSPVLGLAMGMNR